MFFFIIHCNSLSATYAFKVIVLPGALISHTCTTQRRVFLGYCSYSLITRVASPFTPERVSNWIWF